MVSAYKHKLNMLVCTPGICVQYYMCSAAIKARAYLYAYIPISAQSSCTFVVFIRFKLDLICKDTTARNVASGPSAISVAQVTPVQCIMRSLKMTQLCDALY